MNIQEVNNWQLILISEYSAEFDVNFVNYTL